jgi:competence protein ComFC
LWLRSWNPGIDMLVPVPASRVRAVQPVLVLGEAIANELGVEFAPTAVRRTRDTPQLKDVVDYNERSRLLDGLHEVDREKVKGRRVLLFDDLFRSGATMNSIAGVMQDSGQAAEVFAMTVTRTRSHQ